MSHISILKSAFYLIQVILTVCFFPQLNYAQTSKAPLLERTITMTLEQERLDVALKKISQQGGFIFSYSPVVIATDKLVTYTFKNKTIREILDQLFKGAVQYKERNKYVILTKAETSKSEKDAKVLSGYVIDESTGQRLKNVSVYDPISLSSAVTDSYGYFQIEVHPPTGEDIRLAINKRNYMDTLVFVPTNDLRLLNIPIKINKERISQFADSVGNKLRRLWLNTKKASVQAANLENVTDTFYRAVQFSIVPFVGTNGKLSGNVINGYSFNVIGGYSLGVRKAEIGGMFNTVRGDVSGLQIAGLLNGVMGKRKGIQISGLVNANRDSSRGAQMAGLVNFNWNSAQYFALAGLINFTKGNSEGAILAGLGNFTIGKQQGAHIAGLFNFSTDSMKWVQVAGLFNFSVGEMRGTQIGGLVNFAAKKAKGTQLSGILNFAPQSMDGAQFSGLINFARDMTGTQIGLLNISRNIKGVPVGFLSFVSKGYHKIEISADEIFYTNLAFRTGVRQFYNIITAGVKPNSFDENETLWTFGYGIGTAPKLNRKLYLNFDLTSNQIVEGNTIEAINLVNKLYLGCDFQILKKISIAAGVTLNGQVTKTTYDDYPELFTDYQPDIFYTRQYSNDKDLKMWWGAKLGLRFL